MGEFVHFLPLHGDSSLIPGGSRAEVFQLIFEVFLVLGTLVCVVVLGYMCWSAYRYREGNGNGEFDPPALGELPTGGGGGRKLFYSFGVSTVIVVVLIAWTYGTLLYVEEEPTEADDALEIEVVGYQFGWEFVYPNGHTSDTLRVPSDRTVRLTVTSKDVFHTFGVPELRVKTDAIPGQRTVTWFTEDDPGTYEVHCFELCGAGHSYMTADLEVMEPNEYREWYANTTGDSADATNSTNTTTESGNTSAESRTGVADA